MRDDLLSRPQGLFEQLESIHRLLARAGGFDGVPSGIRAVAPGAFPQINVGRTATGVQVFVFAPGIDAESLDVTIERNVLKVSGARTSAIDAGAGAGKLQVYANERPEGRFSRAVSLPDDVDPLKVEATYRDGILRVNVGLSAAAQPQRISVQ